MSTHGAEFDGPSGIGAGHASLQLSKALLAHEHDPDPAVRARAGERVRRWQQVFAHATQHTAHYGSRTPFADVPAWVTPDVATGGFATGHLLAGGELTAYERELAATLPGIRPGSERLDLDLWHLTDAGIESLRRRLADGDYRIDVPEEAALPTVAWLLGQQRVDDAAALIDTLAPWFGRLRLFPAPAQGTPVSAATVHVVAAGEVRQRLATLRPQARLALQTHVVETRLPLYVAAVAHFLLTYADDWPCRHYPDGWVAHAASLCARFDALQHDGIAAARRSTDRAAELHALLALCVRDRDALTGREVGRIRRIVGDFVRAHGHPESAAHRAQRAEQRRHVAAPLHDCIAGVVAARLAGYPSDAGIGDFSTLSMPITADEADAFSLDEGITLPPAIRRRLERCRSGTLAGLIECGLITSGETVARLLPAMTAEIRSAGFADPTLRNLYAATYRAFRRRRSLLLLDLQAQVRLEELPWIAAIDGERRPDAVSVDAARQMLVESATATLSAFPHAIVPNKLLQEFRALATSASLDLAFVDEVAADIFIGEFSNKFIEAARRAAPLIANTVYARYYAIDTQALAALPDRPSAAPTAWWRWGGRRIGSGDALAALCAQRANAPFAASHPAANGMLIEQQQILTTQNLAALFGDLGLRTLLQPRLDALALASFTWLCARQQMRIEYHHARLVMLKNTAYAWRQMLFYLSMLDAPQQRSALDGIGAHFAMQSSVFRDRFLPVMLGLRAAAAGHVLPQQAPDVGGARVFLGWSVGPHWLSPT